MPELKQSPARKELPCQPKPSLKQTATYDMLSLRSGLGFDETFMEHNVSDHEGDVKDFTNQVRNAADPVVKVFARRTVVTLKEHLKLSRSMRDQIKKNRT